MTCTFCAILRIVSALSIQSAKLYIQSSELGPVPPYPQESVTPPLWVQGGRHTRLRGRGGGPNSDDGTDILVLYVNYNPSTVSYVSWPQSHSPVHTEENRQMTEKINIINYFRNCVVISEKHLKSFKRLVAVCHSFWFIIFLAHNTDMRRYITLWLHGWCGLKVAGSWIVAGLQLVCSVVTCDFQVKVSRGITQCSPSGLEPMSRKSEALTAQYLNVRQRKLDTIIIQTVRYHSDCPLSFRLSIIIQTVHYHSDSSLSFRLFIIIQTVHYYEDCPVIIQTSKVSFKFITTVNQLQNWKPFVHIEEVQ